MKVNRHRDPHTRKNIITMSGSFIWDISIPGIFSSGIFMLSEGMASSGIFGIPDSPPMVGMPERLEMEERQGKRQRAGSGKRPTVTQSEQSAREKTEGDEQGVAKWRGARLRKEISSGEQIVQLKIWQRKLPKLGKLPMPAENLPIPPNQSSFSAMSACSAASSGL